MSRSNIISPLDYSWHFTICSKECSICHLSHENESEIRLIQNYGILQLCQLLKTSEVVLSVHSISEKCSITSHSITDKFEGAGFAYSGILFIHSWCIFSLVFWRHNSQKLHEKKIQNERVNRIPSLNGFILHHFNWRSSS